MSFDPHSPFLRGAGLEKTVRWKRSDEGYTESHCGRFEINPLYCGCETPQYFEMYYNPPGGGDRVKVCSLSDTQRDCKAEAEDYLRKLKEKNREPLHQGN